MPRVKSQDDKIEVTLLGIVSVAELSCVYTEFEVGVSGYVSNSIESLSTVGIPNVQASKCVKACI